MTKKACFIDFKIQNKLKERQAIHTNHDVANLEGNQSDQV